MYHDLTVQILQFGPGLGGLHEEEIGNGRGVPDSQTIDKLTNSFRGTSASTLERNPGAGLRRSDGEKDGDC